MSNTTASVATGFFTPNPDPTTFDATDPLVLFIIQISIILGLSRFLSLFLSRMRQPRVIAEVIGGVLLGPTAFGAIPNFTATIFPPSSISYLTLVADIGLVLFLFLVGMEIDFALFRKNLRVSLVTGAAGIIVPFSLGCLVSLGLYRQFVDSTIIPFQHFLLFIATAMSITAFPVLARILTELRLLSDKVGLTVISAGVLNDVVGWSLLALTISLVDSSGKLTILYVILSAVAWTTFLFVVIKPALLWAARRTGSLENRAPTQTMTFLVLLLVFISAFVMDRIQINAIFGGFLVGMVVPRQHNFAHAMTEKIEDLVTVIFVPIYFALSGLKTNLLLLNRGIIWGWVVAVITVAFCGKFFGCFFAARYCGFNRREAGAVGTLMSCKGLIELIFLNIGLQISIITPTIFSIFVLEAIVLTFASTPLTLLFYPPSVRQKSKEVLHQDGTAVGQPALSCSRFSFIITGEGNLAPLMIFTSLIAPYSNLQRRVSTTSSIEEKPDIQTPAIAIDTLHLSELSARTSAVFRASELPLIDSTSRVFSTFATLHGIKVGTASSAVVPLSQFAEAAAEFAHQRDSDLLLLPLTLNETTPTEPESKLGVVNPLESLFGNSSSADLPNQSAFLRRLFLLADQDVAVFIDRNVVEQRERQNRFHLFLAFHGGSDDRRCLALALQLVDNPHVTATIVHVVRAGEVTAFDNGHSVSTPALEHPAGFDPTDTLGGTRAGDTIYPTHNHLASTTADEIALDRARSVLSSTSSFETISTINPLRASISLAQLTTDNHAATSRLVLFSGRGRRDAPSHRAEAIKLTHVGYSSEFCKSVGDVATAYLGSTSDSTILIVQASGASASGNV